MGGRQSFRAHCIICIVLYMYYFLKVQPTVNQVYTGIGAAFTYEVEPLLQQRQQEQRRAAVR